MRVVSLLAVLLVLAVDAHSQGIARLGELVRIENGALRGAPRDPQGVLVFKGIPYAAAPIGMLRWQTPQPAKSWEGVRDAISVGNRCWSNVRIPSLDGRNGGVPQSEDCLY